MKSFFDDFYANKKTNPHYTEQKINIKIAKQIETLMYDQHINERDLAIKLGRSKYYVTRLLRGDVDLSIHFLSKLSIIFKTNLTVNLGD